MNEKSINIITPEGYEVDKEKSSFEKIVFRAVPGLPKTWGDVKEVSGWWVDDDERLREFAVFPTKEEAEASIALAQLCQLRDRYNGGWKPDWRIMSDSKYCIGIDKGRVEASIWYTTQHVLAFQTAALRDEFQKNFSDLIKKAKPLLG